MIPLSDWLCVNRLSLNLNKTTFSLFGPAVQKYKLNENMIKINETSIVRSGKITDKTKIFFWGICLDESMSWKNHVTNLQSKLAKSTYIINKVKHFLPKQTLKTLYYSLFHSNMTYGIMAWGNGDEILKLKDLYECEVSLFMHDYKNNKLPISFAEIYTRNHNSQLRNDLNLYRQRFRTNFSAKFHFTNFLQFGMD